MSIDDDAKDDAIEPGDDARIKLRRPRIDGDGVASPLSSWRSHGEAGP
jgi:hypothetical protein